MSRYPSHQLKQFLTRFPDGMRERIEAAAKANNRTMNAEIVARLERSFSEGGEEKSASDLEQQLRSIEWRLRQLENWKDQVQSEGVPDFTQSVDIENDPLLQRVAQGEAAKDASPKTEDATDAMIESTRKQYRKLTKS